MQCSRGSPLRLGTRRERGRGGANPGGVGRGSAHGGDGEGFPVARPWDSPGKNTGVGCHFLLQCMKVKSESEVAQLCPTLSDPMDCSLPGSSVHGIFQARVLEWGAIAFSVDSASQC